MPPRTGSLRFGSVLGIAGFTAMLFTPTEASAAEQDTIHVRAPREPARRDDSFSRMFPTLPPFTAPTDRVRDKVKKLFDEMVDGCVDRIVRWAPRADGMLR